MSKDAVSDWDTTAANNTDIGGITLAEGSMLPSQVNNALREMMAQIADAGFVGAATTVTLTNKSLSDSTTFIVDNSDATKKAKFEASGITTATTRTFTFPDASGTLVLSADLTPYAKLDTADQTITGGARVTSLALNDGSAVTTGTVTLNPGDRPLQHYTNGGAHTLAPGSNPGSIMLDITNNSNAGAITTSGWTKVVGAFSTTDGDKFRCVCSVGNGGSLLTIQALQ